MKKWKCLQYANYENRKSFVCNTWNMKKIAKQIKKIGKYLFAIHELWKHGNVCLQNMNYENTKYFSVIHELWKYEMFAIHKSWKYENICLLYTNYENRKISAIYELWQTNCKTWIKKIGKYLLTIHELWKHGNVHLKHELWKKINVCNTRIMKIWKSLFAIHELRK